MFLISKTSSWRGEGVVKLPNPPRQRLQYIRRKNILALTRLRQKRTSLCTDAISPTVVIIIRHVFSVTSFVQCWLLRSVVFAVDSSTARVRCMRGRGHLVLQYDSYPPYPPPPSGQSFPEKSDHSKNSEVGATRWYAVHYHHNAVQMVCYTNT